jgi:lipocalin-like protein
MHRIILLATTTLCFGIGASGTATAQTAKDLVGTWTLVASTNVGQDGRKVDIWGPNPKGMYIFDDKGHFVIVNARPDLPKFASNNRNQGTPDENKAIVQGSLSLFGTYSVADMVITYKVEAGSWPAWTGTDQKRTITSFTGDELTYTLAGSIGGTSETKLRRLK